MKILLCPMGSHGDVHPFVGLGIRLKQRGHEPIVVTGELFRSLVEAAGLKFEGFGSAKELRELMQNADLWHPRKALPLIAREAILPGMRMQYEKIVSLHDPGKTLLVGSALGFGCYLAHQTLRLTFVSLHLQPSVIWSEHQSPKLARGMLLGDGVPRWLKRLQHWVGNRMMNRLLLGGANEFRSELNLPPMKNAWDLMHSPQRVVCMFPSWYAAPQPDWPSQVVMADFPLWDEAGVTEVPPAVDEFLGAGEPPIAFTPGSAMVHGRNFFASAAAACRRLGRRGMLLTRHAEQIPADLPPGVRHFDYAPFSEVLPRCAALVYHGGIGTLSQALAAGIPHVIMPMAHDQPDNAARIERLGVGATLWPAQFRGERLAKILDRLLSAPEVLNRCREVATRFEGADGLELACEAVEDLVTPPAFHFLTRNS